PGRAARLRRKCRHDPTVRLLNERGKLQTQSGSIAQGRRMMVADDLRSRLAHTSAVTVMELKRLGFPAALWLIS
ncbi:MAG TPA: hypothetical protein VGQ82_05710, partial [Chthoniobacterales bacterium]|nr:hypothetical protein [Chthoniobacterales bacterium]